MADPDVLVVGGGPAGLAMAAELGRLAISAAVLERGDRVGMSWRSRYDRLRLNTCRFTSKLPNCPYPKGTGQFPSRDQMVSYLDDYAATNAIDVRFGYRVERIGRVDGGWKLETAAGEQSACEVVVATGHQHTPSIPEWPGHQRFTGRLIHAADYQNPGDFEDGRVLVVGPGCTGMEIAYDLAVGGAQKVWIAVRTPPNIMLRKSGPLPGDIAAKAMMRLPTRVVDQMARAVQRATIGDLSQWGLTIPEEGIFARSQREGKAPAVVDKEVIAAIRDGSVEIVAAMESFDENGVLLADGSRLQPTAVIAATGYTTGLEPMVGHLGVLNERGVPKIHGGPPAAAGLRFIGYHPAPGQIGDMGREAGRAAKEISKELAESVRGGAAP